MPEQERVAAESNEEAGVRQPAGKKGLMKLLVSAALVSVIAAAGAAVCVNKLLAMAATPAAAAAEEPAQTTEKSEPGLTKKMDVLVVNLAGTEGRRYIRAGVSLEVANKRACSRLDSDEGLKAKLKDTLIGILRTSTIDIIDSPKGQEKLKRQIRDEVNALLDEPKAVTNVYFYELVVQ